MIDGLMPHQGPWYLVGGPEHRAYVEGWQAAYAEYMRQGQTRKANRKALARDAVAKLRAKGEQ